VRPPSPRRLQTRRKHGPHRLTHKRGAPGTQICHINARTAAGPSPGHDQKEDAKEDLVVREQTGMPAPGGHGGLLAYLFEDFQQGNAAGVGAIDDALGVLEAKAHHSRVNHRGGDAAGTNTRELSTPALQPRNSQPITRPPAKQRQGQPKQGAASPAPPCSATRGARLTPRPLVLRPCMARGQLSSPAGQGIRLPPLLKASEGSPSTPPSLSRRQHQDMPSSARPAEAEPEGCQGPGLRRPYLICCVSGFFRLYWCKWENRLTLVP